MPIEGLSLLCKKKNWRHVIKCIKLVNINKNGMIKKHTDYFTGKDSK